MELPTFTFKNFAYIAGLKDRTLAYALVCASPLKREGISLFKAFPKALTPEVAPIQEDLMLVKFQGFNLGRVTHALANQGYKVAMYFVSMPQKCFTVGKPKPPKEITIEALLKGRFIIDGTLWKVWNVEKKHPLPGQANRVDLVFYCVADWQMVAPPPERKTK